MVTASLLLALSFALPLQVPDLRDMQRITSGRPAFVDFSEDLKKPETVVVFGTLRKTTEGARERIKESEANLGEGSSRISVSGVVYYKVDVTAEIEVHEFLGDAKAKLRSGKVSVALPVQLARMNDGSERTHILTKPQMLLEKPMRALWVLEPKKGKRTLELLRVERFDIADEEAKEPSEEVAKRALDHYGVNRRMADLEMHLARIEDLRKEGGDATGVADQLRALLDEKVRWKLVETDSIALQYVGPLERRARAVLADLEAAAAGVEPGTGGEKPPA